MLNIAKQIYSGWNTANIKHHLPEAEVIPLGSSVNEKKKLETLTKNYPVLKEHDNVPLPGFTLFKTGRKKWGSADQTWLVIDPRGFLVRITNENLEDILHVTGITEGLIQEKCVWARENSQTKMLLVPVTSENYIEAVENTELLDTKVDMKEVQIGDTVLLQNKTTGIYMGSLSLYGPLYGRISSMNVQSWLRRQIVKIDDLKYHYQADLKILKVVKKADNPGTREQSMEEMNDAITRGAHFSNSGHFNPGGYFSSYGKVDYTSVHAVTGVPLTLEEITFEEAKKLFYIARNISDSSLLIIEDGNADKFLIDFPYSYSGRKVPIAELSVEKIKSMAPGKIILHEKKDLIKTIHGLDFYKKFYKIVKNVKKGSYV
jgi:hypothetical protein